MFLSYLILATATFGRLSQGSLKPMSMQINFGSGSVVTIELHTNSAPLACKHIEKLIQNGFYNNQRVFRAIFSPKPFIVQMGDPFTKVSVTDPRVGTGGSGKTVPYEANKYNMTVGAVALATLPGKPNSGDSQFFIVLGDYSDLLKGTATIFGKVTSGMKVVNSLKIGDQIKSVELIPTPAIKQANITLSQ